MAYNENLAARIREALAHLPKVEEKRLFSGITFMVDDRMCISVSDHKIMCRIDPSLHDAAVKIKGCHNVIMGKKKYKGYVYVNEDALTNKSELDYWIGLTLDFNKVVNLSKKSSR